MKQIGLEGKWTTKRWTTSTQDQEVQIESTINDKSDQFQRGDLSNTLINTQSLLIITETKILPDQIQFRRDCQTRQGLFKKHNPPSDLSSSTHLKSPSITSSSMEPSSSSPIARSTLTMADHQEMFPFGSWFEKAVASYLVLSENLRKIERYQADILKLESAPTTTVDDARAVRTRQQIADLEAELVRASTDRVALKVRFSKAVDRFRVCVSVEIREEMKGLKKENETLQAISNSQASSILELQTQMTALQGQQNTPSIAADTIDRFNKSLDERDQTLATMRENHLEAINQLIESFTTRLEASDLQLKESEKKSEELKEQVSAIADRANDIDAQLITVKTSMEEIKIEQAAQSTLISNIGTSDPTEINQLQEQLKQASDQAQTAQSTCNTLSERLDATSTSLDGLINRVQENTDQTGTLQRNLALAITDDPAFIRNQIELIGGDLHTVIVQVQAIAHQMPIDQQRIYDAVNHGSRNIADLLRSRDLTAQTIHGLEQRFLAASTRSQQDRAKISAIENRQRNVEPVNVQAIINSVISRVQQDYPREDQNRLHIIEQQLQSHQEQCRMPEDNVRVPERLDNLEAQFNQARGVAAYVQDELTRLERQIVQRPADVIDLEPLATEVVIALMDSDQFEGLIEDMVTARLNEIASLPAPDAPTDDAGAAQPVDDHEGTNQVQDQHEQEITELRELLEGRINTIQQGITAINLRLDQQEQPSSSPAMTAHPQAGSVDQGDIANPQVTEILAGTLGPNILRTKRRRLPSESD